MRIVPQPGTLARTDVTILVELLREVDALAGARGRSAFVAAAIETRVKRERLLQALDAAHGLYLGTPFEMDHRAAYRWVREQREDREAAPWAGERRGERTGRDIAATPR